MYCDGNYSGKRENTQALVTLITDGLLELQGKFKHYIIYFLI